MKLNFKTYFKFLVLFLVASLFLWNCEKEDVLNSIDEPIATNNAKQSTLKTLLLSDLKSDPTFTKLSSHYLPNLIYDSNKAGHLKSSTDDFIITSDTINVVEKENYISYTLRIKRDIKSSYTVENLVLEEKDSLQKAFIFSYEFEPEWIVEFLGDKKTPPKGKVRIEEYDVNNLKSNYQKSDFCAWIDIWITFPCGCGHYSRPPCTGSTCGGRLFPERELHSVYYCDSNGDGFFDLAGSDGSGGSGGGGGGFPADTADGSETGMVMEDVTELMLYGVMVDLANTLFPNNGQNNAQRDWILDPENYIVGLALNDFLGDNEDSQEAEDFAVSSIDILSEQEVISNNLLDYENAILRITNHLKVWGDPEDEFLADYIESTIPDFPSMTLGDVQDIYKLVRTQSRLLIIKYAEAIIVPFAEAAYPFVIYAVTEATLGAALPLLARIPIAMVIRGARLNKMVKQIGLLGVRGTSNNIRIVTTSSPVTKSRELFNSITRNAISKTTQPNGAIVANMGNGNTITYRTINQSSSGFEATLDLNFSSIWSQVRTVKFKS